MRPQEKEPSRIRAAALEVATDALRGRAGSCDSTTPTPAQRSDHEGNNLTAQPYHRSKMAVNFIVIEVNKMPLCRPTSDHSGCFYESVRVRNNTVGTNGESSYEPKILPLYPGDILRRICHQYATR